MGTGPPMSTASGNRPEHDEQDGQVSETGGLRRADTDDRSSLEAPGDPVAPGDSVAGQPDGESGRTDEGPTGPDAVTFDEEQDHHPDSDGVDTTG